MPPTPRAAKAALTASQLLARWRCCSSPSTSSGALLYAAQASANRACVGSAKLQSTLAATAQTTATDEVEFAEHHVGAERQHETQVARAKGAVRGEEAVQASLFELETDEYSAAAASTSTAAADPSPAHSSTSVMLAHLGSGDFTAAREMLLALAAESASAHDDHASALHHGGALEPRLEFVEEALRRARDDGDLDAADIPMWLALTPHRLHEPDATQRARISQALSDLARHMRLRAAEPQSRVALFNACARAGWASTVARTLLPHFAAYEPKRDSDELWATLLAHVPATTDGQVVDGHQVRLLRKVREEMVRSLAFMGRTREVADAVEQLAAERQKLHLPHRGAPSDEPMRAGDDGQVPETRLFGFRTFAYQYFLDVAAKLDDFDSFRRIYNTLPHFGLSMGAIVEDSDGPTTYELVEGESQHVFVQDVFTSMRYHALGPSALLEDEAPSAAHDLHTPDGLVRLHPRAVALDKDLRFTLRRGKHVQAQNLLARTIAERHRLSFRTAAAVLRVFEGEDARLGSSVVARATATAAALTQGERVTYDSPRIVKNFDQRFWLCAAMLRHIEDDAPALAFERGLASFDFSALPRDFRALLGGVPAAKSVSLPVGPKSLSLFVEALVASLAQRAGDVSAAARDIERVYAALFDDPEGGLRLAPTIGPAAVAQQQSTLGLFEGERLSPVSPHTFMPFMLAHIKVSQGGYGDVSTLVAFRRIFMDMQRMRVVPQREHWSLLLLVLASTRSPYVPLLDWLEAPSDAETRRPSLSHEEHALDYIYNSLRTQGATTLKTYLLLARALDESGREDEVEYLRERAHQHFGADIAEELGDRRLRGALLPTLLVRDEDLDVDESDGP